MVFQVRLLTCHRNSSTRPSEDRWALWWCRCKTLSSLTQMRCSIKMEQRHHYRHDSQKASQEWAAEWVVEWAVECHQAWVEGQEWIQRWCSKWLTTRRCSSSCNRWLEDKECRLVWDSHRCKGLTQPLNTAMFFKLQVSSTSRKSLKTMQEWS